MNQTPRQLIVDLYPELGDLPISGGWGMSQETACIIDKNNPAAISGLAFDPWPIIFTFVEKSIYIQLITSREVGKRYYGIAWNLTQRKTVTDNERVYEWIEFDVSAFREADWNTLKAEWEGGCTTPDFDEQAHLKKRDELRYAQPMIFWFDVTSCCSARLYGVELPWAIGNSLRGAITDYESQEAGQGYSVAYNSLTPPKITSTVYFYTHGHTEISDDIQDETVIEHFRNTLDGIISYHDHKLEQTCELKTAAFFGPPGNPPQYISAELDFSTKTENMKTLLYLTTHDGRFLKIRQTMQNDDASKHFGFEFAGNFSSLLLGSGNGHCENLSS